MLHLTIPDAESEAADKAANRERKTQQRLALYRAKFRSPHKAAGESGSHWITTTKTGESDADGEVRGDNRGLHNLGHGCHWVLKRKTKVR